MRTLERLGVSAIIIEDKKGLKKNSLFADNNLQKQDKIRNICNKIEVGKRAQVTPDFMIIARIESMNLGKGVDNALKRAEAYIQAGADAIMAHSKEKDPVMFLEFCKRYRDFENRVPLVAVPSTFSAITEEELIANGVSMVIYANQLLRSAYPAMVNTARTILENQRALEADETCMPIKEILNLISQEPVQ